MQAEEAGVPVISSMGCGNKLDPTKLKVADIYSTSVCPLAKVMRRELKKRGIKKLKVVYSEEPALKPGEVGTYANDSETSSESQQEHAGRRKAVPGSTAFVPSTAGLIIASEVIKDLIER
jgi:tRNA A37 threonylcarbamoyladenosine dehydratase